MQLWRGGGKRQLCEQDGERSQKACALLSCVLLALIPSYKHRLQLEWNEEGREIASHHHKYFK